VAERAREEERQHEQHGEPHELDPPRDLDRRARAAHRAGSYRGAAAVRIPACAQVWLRGRDVSCFKP
jgi:hypothetical protein